MGGVVVKRISRVPKEIEPEFRHVADVLEARRHRRWYWWAISNGQHPFIMELTVRRHGFTFGLYPGRKQNDRLGGVFLYRRVNTPYIKRSSLWWFITSATAASYPLPAKVLGRYNVTYYSRRRRKRIDYFMIKRVMWEMGYEV